MAERPATRQLRVLVTGGRGKVGSRIVDALLAAGHVATVTDIVPATYGAAGVVGPQYFRADLTDFGQALSTVLRATPDVVVHTAAIPESSHDPAHVVFATNVRSTFNIVEAVAQTGIPRFIYLSSETVPGYATAEKPFLPDYLPVDEAHPSRPQEAYALSKFVGEQIVDSLVRRRPSSAVSVRASFVVSGEADYRFLAALASAPIVPFTNQWCYVDVADLADLVVLAVESDSSGHEVVYAAQPDNFMGRPLSELVKVAYGATAPPLRALSMLDASGINSDKARELFGWSPRRSWRDWTNLIAP